MGIAGEPVGGAEVSSRSVGPHFPRGVPAQGPRDPSLCRALSPTLGSGPDKASPSSSDGERRGEESQEKDRDTPMPSVPMGQGQSSKPGSPDLFQLTVVNFVLEHFHQKFMKHLPCGRPWGNQGEQGKVPVPLGLIAMIANMEGYS